MPEDLSFLDQLEDWLEAQIPNNLHDLPSKMFDTVEKLTNDLCEALPSSVLLSCTGLLIFP